VVFTVVGNNNLTDSCSASTTLAASHKELGTSMKPLKKLTEYQDFLCFKLLDFENPRSDWTLGCLEEG
jgi:hypothetical protein